MRAVILTILDGWGYSKQKLGNAILNAKTPNLDYISRNYPSLLLQASGQTVGLSFGDSGNSEVGHLTIGAGRVVPQYLTKINKAIEDGSFFENPAFVNAINHIKQNGSSLHLVGLLTSNSVHSHFDHLIALIDLAKKSEVKNVFIHLFTDGKDSGLNEAPKLLRELETYIKNEGSGNEKIVSLIGRDIAMDRNNNWDLTGLAFNVLVQGSGDLTNDYYAKLQENYDKGLTDINMPAMISDQNGIVKNNDAIVFFNFREDRMKQLAEAFTAVDLDHFERNLPANLYIAGMTQYIQNPNLNFAYPSIKVENSLGEVLSNNNYKQLRIAESEKQAHVTYFFNCLRNDLFPGEEDFIIKSDRNPAEFVKMKAPEITEKAIEAINSGTYDFILINYANADIISHFGIYEPVIEGVEEVDKMLIKLRDATLASGAILIISSDHGNAESLTYKSTGELQTRHDPNPVPFYLVAQEFERPRNDDEINSSMSEPKGFLSDIAPTILDLFGIQKPVEMTGESLLKLF